MSISETNPITQIAVANTPHNMAGNFVSLGEALKLISQFRSEKKRILFFTSNVDTAFGVIDPNQGNKIYWFVLSSVSGELRTAVAHINLDNWAKYRNFEKYLR